MPARRADWYTLPERAVLSWGRIGAGSVVWRLVSCVAARKGDRRRHVLEWPVKHLSGMSGSIVRPYGDRAISDVASASCFPSTSVAPDVEVCL